MRFVRNTTNEDNYKNEPILSAKPNIVFNNDHQKISPPNGYPIMLILEILIRFRLNIQSYPDGLRPVITVFGTFSNPVWI